MVDRFTSGAIRVKFVAPPVKLLIEALTNSSTLSSSRVSTLSLSRELVVSSVISEICPDCLKLGSLKKNYQ